MSKKVTAEKIYESLRKKFGRPEWALLFEVGNGTGDKLGRWADALAMNMYPSKGLAIVGFGIKVSRNDLIKELEHPTEAVEMFCNQWYLVVPKGLIAKTDIIPTEWGVLEYNEETLRQTKKPSDLVCQPVTKEFLAAMLRRDEETYSEEIKQLASVAIEIERKNATRKYTQLIEQVNNFESVSGIDINHCQDSRELGKAVRIVQELGIIGTHSLLDAVRSNMQNFLNETDKLIQETVVK